MTMSKEAFDTFPLLCLQCSPCNRFPPSHLGSVPLRRSLSTKADLIVRTEVWRGGATEVDLAEAALHYSKFSKTVTLVTAHSATFVNETPLNPA
jgi:hypothetical protein